MIFLFNFRSSSYTGAMFGEGVVGVSIVGISLGAREVVGGAVVGVTVGKSVGS